MKPRSVLVAFLKRKRTSLNLLLVIGGKLVYLYTKKQGKVPKCGDCKKVKLQGVSGQIVLDSFYWIIVRIV